MKKIKPLSIFLLFFTFWLLLISNLWPYPILLLSYFILTKSKNDALIYIIAGITDPLGEIIVSKSGLWTYHGTTLLGIPYWLPLAWGITAISVYKLISALVKSHFI